MGMGMPAFPPARGLAYCTVPCTEVVHAPRGKSCVGLDRNVDWYSTLNIADGKLSGSRYATRRQIWSRI